MAYTQCNWFKTEICFGMVLMHTGSLCPYDREHVDESYAEHRYSRTRELLPLFFIESFMSKENEMSSANYKLHELTVSTLGRYIVTLRGPFISENWEGRKFQK